MVALTVHVIGGHLLQQNNAFVLCLGFATGGLVWEVQHVAGRNAEAASKPPKMSLHY